MKFKAIILASMLLMPLLLSAQVEETDNTEYENYEMDSSASSSYYMAPPYARIHELIDDSGSEFYYPSLVKRFAQADTTMSFDQLYCFYYGSVFQKWYSPYDHSDEEEDALELLNQDQLSKKDAKKVIKWMNKAIKEVPTHLRLYLYRWVAEGVLYGRDSKQAQDDSFRYSVLLDMISASGDGTSEESAFYVTMTQHSYELMNAYGFTPLNQSLQVYKGQSYDVFSVEDNEYGIDQLFFNVNPCLLFWSGKLADAEIDYDHVEDGTIASMSWNGDSTGIKLNNNPGELTIGSHSRVVVELGEPDSNGIFEAEIVEISFLDDTLSLSDDSLDRYFPKEEPSNHIIFYLTPGAFSSDNIQTFLTFKNYTPYMLNYDSYILPQGASQFMSTSNIGMYSGARGTEMWPEVISVVKISRIRKL